MIEWIIIIIISLIIGYFIGRYLTQKQKFGDRESVLNAQWEKKIANLEKDYEVKIEKGNSLLEKIKEENKTHLEKLAKEWQVKYISDIEELKRLFKDSEKIIRSKSVSSSRRSLVGKFIERFIPFLKKLPYEPSDMHFLGQPVDYIVFQGLHEDKIDRVIFVEVKTGSSKLTKREKSLKETIEKKRVGWKEINIDTADDNLPDKDMANEDTSIKDLYDTIEQKVSSVKGKVPKLKKYKTEEGEEEETDFVCPECGKVITLELDEEDNLKEGIETDCPHCKQEITLYEEDLEKKDE
jgi:predicted Holliday junction resolvase-like endonuclease/predicted RNA-binding Zn-ribbon protein involved in translation (DUF1610 family)